MLVWALVIGFLVWGDVPTVGLLAGSTVVVGSGLFLLWHETQAASRGRYSEADDSSEQQRQRETDYSPLNEWSAQARQRLQTSNNPGIPGCRRAQ
jgi:hypothetical protein